MKTTDLTDSTDCTCGNVPYPLPKRRSRVLAIPKIYCGVSLESNINHQLQKMSAGAGQRDEIC
jgi:hypothetical protein